MSDYLHCYFSCFVGRIFPTWRLTVAYDGCKAALSNTQRRSCQNYQSPLRDQHQVRQQA